MCVHMVYVLYEWPLDSNDAFISIVCQWSYGFGVRCFSVETIIPFVMALGDKAFGK